MTMIMTGVASTGGNIASLKRFARWSGATTRVNEPLAPIGIVCMSISFVVNPCRHSHRCAAK